MNAVTNPIVSDAADYLQTYDRTKRLTLCGMDLEAILHAAQTPGRAPAKRRLEALARGDALSTWSIGDWLYDVGHGSLVRHDGRPLLASIQGRSPRTLLAQKLITHHLHLKALLLRIG